jgi:subfamily B ATP-binding cassette protein MsbA
VASPTAINDARVGYYRRRNDQFSYSSGQNWAQQLGIPGVSGELMPQFGAAVHPTDPVFTATERYLSWVSSLLPAGWNAGTPWGLFNILAVTLLVIYAVWGVALYYRSYWAQVAGHRVMLDLRTDLFQHVQRLSHAFYQARQSGGIVSRMTADIALAQNFVGAAMTNIWMDVVSCVFYLALLLSMDVQLTLVSLLVFPLYILCMRTFGAKSKRTSMQVQEAMEEFSGDLQERVAGYALVKSFAAERREARTFFASARGLYDLVMDNTRITNLSSTLVQWLTEMATLVVIWYGGYRIFKGESTIGEVIAFIMLLRQLYFPVNRISEIVNGKRGITADTALRLGKYFGVSPEIWLDLQSDYELRVARRDVWPKAEPRVRSRAAA